MTAPAVELREAPEHPLVGLAVEAARESLRAAELPELDESQLRSLLLARYVEYGKPGGLPQEPGMLFKVQALVNSRIMDANPDGVRLPVAAALERLGRARNVEPALLSAVRELINVDAPQASRALDRRLAALAERGGVTPEETRREFERLRAAERVSDGATVSKDVADWLNELPRDAATIRALAQVERRAPLLRPGTDGSTVCVVCGATAVAGGHSCGEALNAPARVWDGEIPEARLSTAALALRMPSLLELADELSPQGAPFEFPVAAQLHPERKLRSPLLVTGRVVAAIGADSRLVVAPETLSCTCRGHRSSGQCEHVGIVVEQLRECLVRCVPERDREIGAQALRLAARHREQAGQAAAAPAPDLGAVSVEQAALDAKDFAEVARGAQLRRLAGGEPVPLLLGEDCAPLGRTWGLELEFDLGPPDLPPDEVERRLNLVADVLQREGLIPDTRIRSPEEVRRLPYSTELTGGWRLVRDGSCHGELVSPLLHHDDPRVGPAIDRACRALREAGAIVTERTGTHITTGVPGYAGQPRKAARELRFRQAFADPLSRFATDPDSERGFYYAQPLPEVPPEGFVSVDHVAHSLGRNRECNMLGLGATPADWAGSRKETRSYDGCLSAGVVQARARFEAKLTNFLEANPRYEIPAPRPLGSTVAEFGNPRPGDPRFTMSTEQSRTLLNLLGYRGAERDQAIRLWASGAWRDDAGKRILGPRQPARPGGPIHRLDVIRQRSPGAEAPLTEAGPPRAVALSRRATGTSVKVGRHSR